jgi:hypothetical protein
VLLRVVPAASAGDGALIVRPGPGLLLAGALGGWLAAGCRPATPPAPAGRASFALSPDPARVGPAVLSLSLQDAAGRPVTGARWRIEGHMTHPGMRPVVAGVTEHSEGAYEARLSFTMPGDWVLLARADWAGGGRLEEQVPVRVRP